MILVDVFVPMLDQYYDFKLDETASIGVLADEMLAILCQWEGYDQENLTETAMICDLKSNRILNPMTSLRDNGVESGDQLLLV